jgi:prepilin-type N-terminal cleavage/methylation domain-containing protein
MKKLFLKHSSKGFTIIEMLVAVTILIIAIGAPLYLSTQGIALSISSKNRLIATFLAEEGIEYIKHRRDSNIISILGGANGVKWDDGFSSASDCLVLNDGNTYGCTVDVFSGVISKCGNKPFLPIISAPLYCEELGVRTVGNEKRYGYGSGYEPSGFIRTITTRRCTGASCPEIDEIKVTSRVTWIEKNKQYNVEVEDILFELICTPAGC